MILKTIKAEKVICPKEEKEITIAQCSKCKSHDGIRNTYTEIICKYMQFENAPEVKEIAQELIKEHHVHLLKAKVIFLFRNGTWKVNRKAKLGNTEKCSGKVKHLTGADFIITINGDFWPHMDKKAQLALVDHELCHCGYDGEDEDGNNIWFIVPHTIQDFAAVIKRHGLWDPDSAMIARAMAESNKVQLELFKDDQSGLKLVSSN